MSAVYTMIRKNAAADRSERRASYAALAILLSHLDQFGSRLEALSVDVDGTVTVTLSARLPDDQLEHLGLVR